MTAKIRLLAQFRVADYANQLPRERYVGELYPSARQRLLRLKFIIENTIRKLVLL